MIHIKLNFIQKNETDIKKEKITVVWCFIHLDLWVQNIKKPNWILHLTNIDKHIINT